MYLLNNEAGWIPMPVSTPLPWHTIKLQFVGRQFGGLVSLLSPWSGVLLEKLTGSQLVKNFPSFYGEHEGSLLLLQVPANSPYPMPEHSCPCPHIPLPEDPS